MLVLVAVWIDPSADDETAVRLASRAATLQGDRDGREGRDPAAARALVERARLAARARSTAALSP